MPSFLKSQSHPKQSLDSIVQELWFNRKVLEVLRRSPFSHLQVYVSQVCEDVISGPLNSAVQLAGLRLLTNMTVTNAHQDMLSSYITDLFHVLVTGNGSTKVWRKWWLFAVQTPTASMLLRLKFISQVTFLMFLKKRENLKFIIKNHSWAQERILFLYPNTEFQN